MTNIAPTERQDNWTELSAAVARLQSYVHGVKSKDSYVGVSAVDLLEQRLGLLRSELASRIQAPELHRHVSKVFALVSLVLQRYPISDAVSAAVEADVATIDAALYPLKNNETETK